jgi:glyceraldehyde 3-phosphate dehydrogenase-like protein
MPTRVAINGFGRIGRSFVRSAYERGADIEIVAVNDVADPATLANLLVYDSVFGRFPAKVSLDGDTLAFDGNEIRLLSERDPNRLPWTELASTSSSSPLASSARGPTPRGISTPALARSSSRLRARARSPSTPMSCSA